MNEPTKLYYLILKLTEYDFAGGFVSCFVDHDLSVLEQGFGPLQVAPQLANRILISRSQRQFLKDPR